jgi:hypothetical protein
MGHESKVVLPGPGFSGDATDVVRASISQMRSSTWWRDQRLDGLIMVAWGRHQDTPIVRAIAESGTPLVLHIDGTCSHFPLFDTVENVKTLWRCEHDMGGRARRTFSFICNLAHTAVALTIKHSYLKYRHLRFASVVTCQTPLALERNRRLCRLFGGRSHGVKLELVGYPISTACGWSPDVVKERRIVSVGRWDDLRQKRPGVLMAVCERLARKRKDVAIDIFGLKTDALEMWHGGLDLGIRQRILLRGQQPGGVVAQAMTRSQISFFPSSYEGGPQALFEALRCGASTVALDSPFMPASRWATDAGHGDLAAQDTTEAFVEALERGLDKWHAGTYQPRQISSFWEDFTHVERVLTRMIHAALEAGANGRPSQHT